MIRVPPVNFPSRDEFRAKAREGNLIPVWREVVADMETPVSAFRKIGATSPYAFLLESVENGETLGRYSFIGAEPRALFRSRGHEVDIAHGNGNRESFTDPVPIDRLRDLMATYRAVPDPALPPFAGGAVGYIGYDEIRNLEPSVGATAKDDLGLPDILFMVTDTLLVFDHIRHRVRVVVNAFLDDRTTVDEAYDDALRRINRLGLALARPVPRMDKTVGSSEMTIESNLTREAHAAMVARAQEYIAAGDAFQVVLSQRLTTPVTCDPFDVYRALRAVNPSPYMFYLQLDGIHLAGSSPEILVRLVGDEVTLRPIAGTRGRGATPAEDAALRDELLADPKERAEHIMLVDLGRNDVGRVCEYGSVRVDDLMTVEKYSHVMHIVSNVTGTLRPGLDAFDVFKATFPAGTLSGAPKVRAMQIIDELEPTARGTYGGSIGYFGFNGNLDACITIRTALIKDGRAYVQAGGGIVADSDAGDEFQETLNKAGAVLNAIRMAEAGLE